MGEWHISIEKEGVGGSHLGDKLPTTRPTHRGRAAVCFTSSPTFISPTSFSYCHCLLHGGHSLGDTLKSSSCLLSQNISPQRVEMPLLLPCSPGLDYLGAPLPKSVLLNWSHQPYTARHPALPETSLLSILPHHPRCGKRSP